MKSRVHQLIICGRMMFGAPAHSSATIRCRLRWTCHIAVAPDFFLHTDTRSVCGAMGIVEYIPTHEACPSACVLGTRWCNICMLTAKLVLHKHQFAIQFLSKTFAIVLWLVLHFGHSGKHWNIVHIHTHTIAFPWWPQKFDAEISWTNSFSKSC